MILFTLKQKHNNDQTNRNNNFNTDKHISMLHSAMYTTGHNRTRPPNILENLFTYKYSLFLEAIFKIALSNGQCTLLVSSIQCPKIDVPPALDSKRIFLERGK